MAREPRVRGKKRYYFLGAFVIALVALVALWNWDWFIPLAEREASAALGRPVTITHLHLHLARRPTIEADGIAIANPDGFPDNAPFATVKRLRVQLDVPAYLRDRDTIVIPMIAVDNPVVELRELADGKNNWTLGTSAGTGGSSGPTPKIGDLRITDGHARVLAPALKSDFSADIATRERGGGENQIVVTAKGTYADQPITGRFVGGALLSLRDATNPYPVELHVANGPTHVDLTGTIRDPLQFAGADLKLEFSGPDLSRLYPLTGVPIPTTPSYQLTGHLDYADKRIRFRDFDGRVGSSDLEGEFDIQPGAEREMISANLASRKVDLADLGGFIGSTPGRKSTPDETPAQRAAVAKAEASPRLIPNTPLNVPKLRAADIDLHYRGAHIAGQSVPLDNVVVALTIKDGNIDLHPISFGVGRGTITGNITLDNEQDTLHAKANIDFRQVDLARLMAATHTFSGAGLIGGSAVLDGTGNSLAALLGHGNGELKLFMGHGGDISALLVDLSGLEFGNALASALGIPNRATLNCLVSDFGLRDGVVSTQTLLLDTSEANVTGTGTVNLRDETLDMRLRTQARHFSIGSLPAPIEIDGTFKDPSIHPNAAILGARIGAAVGLGVLLTPLGALIPTIQLGLGPDNDCERAINSGATAAARPPPAARVPRRPRG
jgi:uncharacterized protein involved in outer membrane biogenesis